MKFPAALCFWIIGLEWMTSSFVMKFTKHKDIAIAACAFIILSIIGQISMAMIYRVDFSGIPFFKEQLQKDEFGLGYPSIASLICFFTYAIYLLSIVFHWRKYRRALLLSIIVISIVSLIGHIIGVSYMYFYIQNVSGGTSALASVMFLVIALTELWLKTVKTVKIIPTS